MNFRVNSGNREEPEDSCEWLFLKFIHAACCKEGNSYKPKNIANQGYGIHLFPSLVPVLSFQQGTHFSVFLYPFYLFSFQQNVNIIHTNQLTDKLGLLATCIVRSTSLGSVSDLKDK